MGLQTLRFPPATSLTPDFMRVAWQFLPLLDATAFGELSTHPPSKQEFISEDMGSLSTAQTYRWAGEQERPMGIEAIADRGRTGAKALRAATLDSSSS